jgi:inorganic pyrophosphatase
MLVPEPEQRFWQAVDRLVDGASITVDRPKGSRHPTFPDLVYPLDYGSLDGTRAVDGDAVDVWLGSLPGRRVTGLIVTVDLIKRDAEVKLLIGCTRAEAAAARTVHNDNPGSHAGLLIERPAIPPGSEAGST